MINSRLLPWRASAVIFGLVGALSVGSAGCKRSGAPNPKTGAQSEGSRSTEIVHEDCNLEAADEKLDANGDGRPEVSIVMKGGRPICQGVDLNQDGIIDVYAYFSENGQVRRREYAYSRDAQINEIRLYRGGKLAEAHQSTAVGGRLDTWHYFERSRRVRTERDSNGDGIVDEWWEYPDKTRPGCPMMYSDGNGDAKPDADSAVDLCKEGRYTPPARGDAEPSTPAPPPGPLPGSTEPEGSEESAEGGGDVE